MQEGGLLQLYQMDYSYEIHALLCLFFPWELNSRGTSMLEQLEAMRKWGDRLYSVVHQVTGHHGAGIVTLDVIDVTPVRKKVPTCAVTFLR